MTLTFTFSPCPNDTFMFEAIINKKIDLQGLDFKIKLHDVEHLNKTALNHLPDITKISFNAYTKVYDRYQLLNCGSALGNNCGPLLIAKKSYQIDDIPNLTIGVPGYNTTAFLLLKYAFPESSKFKEYVFSDIETALQNGEIDAGLIIHENRFTYHQKGLNKIIDLGEYWETHTGSPIPLGGIAIKRSLPLSIRQKVNAVLRDSIQYAFDHPNDGMDFIQKNAQEMENNVMMSHINLYVNDFSKNIGEQGKKAVYHLFKVANLPIQDQELHDLFVS